MESDVAKPERAHDGERPIEPRHPTVLLPFVEHEDVKEETVDDHQEGEREKKADQQRRVGAVPRKKVSWEVKNFMRPVPRGLASLRTR